MTTEERRTAKSEKYAEERADSLPFNTLEKSDRYRTERFPGAIGLNWFDCDPTLQRDTKFILHLARMLQPKTSLSREVRSHNLIHRAVDEEGALVLGNNPGR